MVRAGSRNLLPKGGTVAKAKPVYIYVKAFPVDGKPAEVVHKVLIPRSNLYARHIEKVERGMLINMDTERFFVDTDDADKAAAAREKALS